MALACAAQRGGDMYLNRKLVLLLTAAMLVGLPPAGAVKKRFKTAESKVESTEGLPALLWREPTDIASRNLYYGPGGEKHQPHGPFTFEKEDLNGTSPKFVVRDEDGMKWKVKLGAEPRPETAATRLVWAAGYFANEVYFVRELHVQGMPPRLKRGQKLVEPGGIVRNVRLKVEPKGEKKIANWRWSQNPFPGTRELNG